MIPSLSPSPSFWSGVHPNPSIWSTAPAPSVWGSTPPVLSIQSSGPPAPSTQSNIPPTISVQSNVPPTPSTQSNVPPAPSTLKNAPTSSSSSEDTYMTIATQFTVGAPPSICTSSKYSYETKMSIPTGYVYFRAGGTGWGPEGSIWNITTGAGAKLTKMKASCQGSICTGISGNQVFDGKMKQRVDGSWYMNVTKDMQSSLMVTGQLVQDTPKRRRFAKRLKTRDSQMKYPLKVVAVPPCGLPVAKKCTSWDYSGDQTQWEAYQVDKFMKSYLSKNDITNFDDFRVQAMKDFLPAKDASNPTCDITQDFDCPLPDSDVCLRRPTDDETRGLMMTDAVIRFTKFMHMLYEAAKGVQGTIGDQIDAIVHHIWKPAAEQTWNKIMSVMSAVIGIMIAGFVLLDVVLPEVAWTGFLVTGAIAASNAFGIAGNVGALQNPSNGDTQFGESSDYKQGAQNMLSQVMAGFPEVLTNKGTGQDGLYKVFQGGAWVTNDVYNAFNAQGYGANTTGWFEKLMVAQYVTKALTDNDAYILFIRYGDDVQYNGKKWGFDKETCEKRWLNDPSWKYSVTCEMDFGPGGDLGMALLTRPSSEGSSSSAWLEDPINYRGQEITAWDVISSGVWGQVEHGFNYTLLDQDWTKVLSGDNGMQNAQAIFSSTSANQPGLYNPPMCEVKDLAYISGVQQVMSDQNNSPGKDGYYHADNPCPCANYEYTSPDGKSGKFTDFVSDKVKDSIGDGCKISGHMWAPDQQGDEA